MKKKRWLKRSLWSVFFLFALLNTIAAFHAWKFTHFDAGTHTKPREEKSLSFSEKLHALAFGVNLPRPVNDHVPTQPYETIVLQSNGRLECWYIKTANAKGTVILFHGYGGKKSDMTYKSDEFIKMGHSTLLVDFIGSGGSEGNQTTIGSKESENVKTCYDYLRGKGEKNICLFGTSMGAAAILKSIHDYKISPEGIIIECPYGTMYQTVCARFRTMHVPNFPMAGLLVFWGGLENGFNAFALNPSDYARDVRCPSLLLYGEQDEKVSRAEIDTIYNRMQGVKVLRTFPEVGHNNYLIKYHKEWVLSVDSFLTGTMTGRF
jgi:pimeloyl-ACP methyl ester carboxylesterase